MEFLYGVTQTLGKLNVTAASANLGQFWELPLSRGILLFPY